MIDHYCERTATGLLAEPWNLISNLAFLLVAWLVFRSRPQGLAQANLFAALLVMIALGSATFHSLANKFGEIADSLAILVFVSVYLAVCLHRFYSRNYRNIILALVVFVLTNLLIIAQAPLNWLNGSLFYLPSWFALLLLALFAPLPSLRRQLLLGLTIFSVSLTLRGIDMAICDRVPIGSHYLWHIINAGLLYGLLRSLAQDPNSAYNTKT